MALLVLCVFLPAFPVFTQGSSGERGDLWFCPGVEAALNIINLSLECPQIFTD
jgi:hypothetical protein